MIEPVRMTKVYIAGAKRVLDKTVGLMHGLGIVHIEDYKKGKYDKTNGFFEIGKPFERAGKYSEQLVRARSLVSKLLLGKGAAAKGKRGNSAKASLSRAERSKAPFRNPEKRLAKIEGRFAKIDGQIKAAERNLSELKGLVFPAEFFSFMQITPEKLQDTENIVTFCGIVKKDFEKGLNAITKNYELFKKEFQGKTGFVLLVKRGFEKEVSELLAKNDYREVRIPEGARYAEPGEIGAELERAEKSLGNLKVRMEELAKQDGPFLIAYEKFLKRENEKAEAPLRFATASNSFLVEGYVPVNRYGLLKKTLESALGGKIQIERAAEEVDFAPTELKNPSLVDSFEFFLNLYSLPFYKELDPTFIMFLTFPLFFGFMLGDIGYGIVTGIVFLAIKLRTKSNVLKGLMNVMMLASAATIFFGFVFAEFFGGPLFGLRPLIRREHDIILMLLITILVGIIHVNIGFVLGFFNVKRLHGLKAAVFEKGGWLVTEAGAFLMLFQIYDFFYTGLPHQLYVGLAIALVGIGMLLKGHGAFGLIELPSVASNVLSYARLFAIGLASVALAVIINEFATGFIHQGGFMFIPAILILVMGHMLNIAIGVVGGFLQSLRLHYVEFFTKFYKGGGKKYTPFGG